MDKLWDYIIDTQIATEYEDNCNGTIDEFRYITDTDILYLDVETKVKDLDLKVYFQTDPRR